MTATENNPATLVSVPNDLEAAMIVNALAGQGIDATTTGSFTAGFQAEAPGEVKVLVRSCDLESAREALQGISDHTSPSATPVACGSTQDAGTPAGMRWNYKQLFIVGGLVLWAILMMKSCL